MLILFYFSKNYISLRKTELEFINVVESNQREIHHLIKSDHNKGHMCHIIGIPITSSCDAMKLIRTTGLQTVFKKQLDLSLSTRNFPSPF